MRETWVGKIPWRRERLPAPAFWPGEFHGLYSPRDQKESDTTEQLSLSHFHFLPHLTAVGLEGCVCVCVYLCVCVCVFCVRTRNIGMEGGVNIVRQLWEKGAELPEGLSPSTDKEKVPFSPFCFPC